MTIPITFFVLYLLTFAFGFLAGFHNSANVVATVISSRAMRPRQILILAAVAEFAGPFLFGTAVARTIGADLVDPEEVTIQVIIAAMLAAIIWKLITWRLAIPASASHSLFGGLIGAVLVGAGVAALQPEGVRIIVLFLLLSPIVAFLVGYMVMLLTLFLTRGATPKVNNWFRRGQLFSSLGLAMTHGSNDGQKLMGILALGLVITGLSEQFVTPPWIVTTAAAAIGLGTLVGGRRIISTLGRRFYKIRPVHGFASQTTSAAIILFSVLAGGPVSTSEVVSSSIVGVGASERVSKVRWVVFRDIALAWLLTLPITALLAGVLYWPVTWLVP
jgi:PiT family inorganic phosphate transporter